DAKPYPLPGSADVSSAQRSQHAPFHPCFQKEGSRFALTADGTSALPARSVSSLFHKRKVRASRSLRTGRPRSQHAPFHPCFTKGSFALRAHCGRGVRAPSTLRFILVSKRKVRASRSLRTGRPRSQHALFHPCFQKEVSRFALTADGTSAFPAQPQISSMALSICARWS